MASEVDVLQSSIILRKRRGHGGEHQPARGFRAGGNTARASIRSRATRCLNCIPWGFATKCAQFAAMGISRPEWRFAYAQPADAIKIVAVLPHDAAIIEAGIDNAQPFSCEIDDTGADIILTNQVNAVARYISLVRDTNQVFAAICAGPCVAPGVDVGGPLLKGDVGAAESKRCVSAMQAYLSQAMVSDANQRKTKPTHMPAWMRRPRRQLRGGQPPRLAEWVEGLMSNVRVLQRSFGGGEISPEMFGRIDDVKYQSGLAICRNFVVRSQGPVENRAGFSFVREVKDSTKRVGLIPFTYSVTQTMVIELGAGYFRFHTHGGTLLDGGTPYEIANP